MELWQSFLELGQDADYHVGFYYADGDAERVYPFETLLGERFGLRCFLKSRDWSRGGWSATEMEVIHTSFIRSKAVLLFASQQLLRDPMLKLLAHAIYNQKVQRPGFVVIVAALENVVLPRALYLASFPRVDLYEGSIRTLRKLAWHLLDNNRTSSLCVVDTSCFGDVVKTAGLWWKSKIDQERRRALDNAADGVMASLHLKEVAESGCRLCGRGVVDALRDIHGGVCAATLAPCPSEGCEVVEERCLLSSHVRICPFALVRCTNCEGTMARMLLKKHQVICSVRRANEASKMNPCPGTLWELLGTSRHTEDKVRLLIHEWHSRSCAPGSGTAVSSLDELSDNGLTSYPVKELLKLLVLYGDMSVQTYDELSRHADSYSRQHCDRSDNFAYLSALRSLCPTMWSALVRTGLEPEQQESVTTMSKLLKVKETPRLLEKPSTDRVMQILMKPRGLR